MTESFQEIDILHVDDKAYRIYPFTRVKREYAVDKVWFNDFKICAKKEICGNIVKLF